MTEGSDGEDDQSEDERGESSESERGEQGAEHPETTSDEERPAGGTSRDQSDPGTGGTASDEDEAALSDDPDDAAAAEDEDDTDESEDDTDESEDDTDERPLDDESESDQVDEAAENPRDPDWTPRREEGPEHENRDAREPMDGERKAKRPASSAASSGASGGSSPTRGTPAAAGGGGSGFNDPATAPDDQEMPLTEHVEEMALRFMAVGLVVVGVGAITLFYADELINFLWYSFLGPGLERCPGPDCPDSVAPRVYHPLALVLARLKVASLVGMIAAMPVAVYQTYRFMRPGLYPRERRYYLAAVPTSLVLAGVGVGFAYFAILPAMFSYFTTYSERAAEIAFGLTETFNLIVLMIGFFAIVFQIPLLVMLAIMMGVTTRRWLEDRRLYFWGGFAALAFLFSPDPTGMAPLMVAVTMIVLFEGTLMLLRWTASDSPLFSPEAFESRRPYAWGLAVLTGYVVSTAPVPASYYDQLPDLVRETLVYNELVTMTPIITAAVLVLLFEAVAYLVRNYSRNVRVWHAVNRSRFPVWMLALVAGYFASPNPPGLQSAQQVGLPTTEAVAITAGLVVGFELLILGLRWRKNRARA